jgi:hypothetical protein
MRYNWPHYWMANSQVYNNFIQTIFSEQVKSVLYFTSHYSKESNARQL